MKNSVGKKVIYLGFFAALTSCTCGTPLKVTSIQGDDKNLACKDVILEINEAEHYRDQAAGAEGINLGNALAPVCWVSSYVDANEAIKAANARIDYLGRIYELMDCGGNEMGGGQSSSAPPPPPVAIPMSPSGGGAFPPPSSSGSSMQSPMPATKSVLSQTGGYFKKRPDLGPNMHEHRDSRDKIYIHSHPHSGAHRHLED